MSLKKNKENMKYKIQNISIIFFYKTPVVFDIIVLNS